MKTRITLLTLAVASLSAFAADITGTWKAEFETQRGLQKYTFNLKQDGANVTGMASVEREGEKREAEFKEGKVEGDTVTFVEPLKIQDNEIKIIYTGKISGDEINLLASWASVFRSHRQTRRRCPSRRCSRPARTRRASRIRRADRIEARRQARVPKPAGRFRQRARRHRPWQAGDG